MKQMSDERIILNTCKLFELKSHNVCMPLELRPLKRIHKKKRKAK